MRNCLILWQSRIWIHILYNTKFSRALYFRANLRIRDIREILVHTNLLCLGPQVAALIVNSVQRNARDKCPN